MIQINGQAVAAAGKTLSAYLAETAFDLAHIAVERNGEIVPKKQYDQTILAEGDVLEIVGFVGGG